MSIKIKKYDGKNLLYLFILIVKFFDKTKN